MRGRSRLRPLPVAALAAVGVILGHWAAYMISVRQASARMAILEASGHGYWLTAVRVAVVLGFVAVGSTVAGHVSARLTGESAELDGGFALWGRLSFLQVLAFTAMEIAERLTAHVPVASMFQHELFAVGLAVQVAVALAAALVLRWLSGTVERFVLAVRRSPRLRPPSILTRRASVLAPVKSPLAGAAGLRGPPSIVRI